MSIKTIIPTDRCHSTYWRISVNEKEEYTRCDWRCGSVETCRKAIYLYSICEAAPCGGRAVTVENYGKSDSEEPEESLPQHREEKEA